jgi:hypothetical protein
MDAAKQELEQARKARDKVRGLVKKIAAVNGVGISRVDGRYAVKINLEKKAQRGAKIPDSVDGVPIVTHIVGKIRKQA